MVMRENVLERVRAVEEKQGIRYAKKDGPGYRRLRILYTLAGIYAFAMHLLLIMGLIVMEKLGQFKTELIVLGIASAMIIGGYILTFLRKEKIWWDLIAALISIAAAVALAILFAGMLEAEVITNNVFRYKPSYYYRHLAPLAIMILTIIAMTVIVLREKRILRKEYKQVLETLYTAYREKQGESFSKEAWQAFLDTYDPAKHKEIFETKEKKNKNS